MDYRVKLDMFEGPLDLLLHLIKKNEVDIYDIPIAAVTEQYLEYIEMIKQFNLDIAGEFLLMAATLIHIKSRMLLPVTGEPEEGEEEGDPREELIRRLIEYQRYKDAAAEIGERNLLGRDVFVKGMTPLEEVEAETEEALVNLSIFDLMEALKEVFDRTPGTVSINLSDEKLSVIDKINEVMAFLRERTSAAFTALFSGDMVKSEIIVTFLAVLELVKMRMIHIYQSEEGGITVYIPEEVREGNDGEAE
ncbi:MAG: segregation and condensation protein A [Thermodesulfobacteriota bacterium]